MKNLRCKLGFSLTEVLITVAVLLLLMGALMGFGKHLKHRGQIDLCRGTLEILVAAIEQYYDFHEAFPAVSVPMPPPQSPLSPIESLYVQLYSLPKSRAVCEQIQKALTGDTDGDKFGEFRDPWGTPLDYRYVLGQTFPKIVSAGPDGTFNTGDDISSK